MGPARDFAKIFLQRQKSLREFERKRRRSPLRVLTARFPSAGAPTGLPFYCARIHPFPQKRRYAQIESFIGGEPSSKILF